MQDACQHGKTTQRRRVAETQRKYLQDVRINRMGELYLRKQACAKSIDCAIGAIDILTILLLLFSFLPLRLSDSASLRLK